MSRARWRGVWAYLQTEFGAAWKIIYLAFWILFIFDTSTHLSSLRDWDFTIRIGSFLGDGQEKHVRGHERWGWGCVWWSHSICYQQVWLLFKWHLLHLYRQIGDRQKTCCKLKIQDMYKLEVC